MKDIFILDTYFNINHLITKSCVLQAYSEKGLEEPVFGGYDDFNTGADFCGIDRLKDFVRGVNPKQRVIFYAINDKNIKDLMSFKETNKLDNFIICHSNTIIEGNQYSKIAQYKFLETKGYKRYLPLVMYLDNTYMLKEGISSGSRGCMYCNEDMMILKRIDAIATWVLYAYARNGEIINTQIGTMEDIYYRSGTKFITLEDKNFNQSAKDLSLQMIKDMKLSGICEVEFLEDKDHNLWYIETNLRPAIYASDYLREGVVNYIKDFI